jgi:predicted dehydrogenase
MTTARPQVGPVRAGIIGAGFMGGVHAQAIHASGGVLSRVADHTAEGARAGASRLGARHVSGSVAELISASDVDVVHICTPNVTHADFAHLALAAGKSVICEKPLATAVSDTQRLADQAAYYGAVAAVPFVYRYYPSVREARARIADRQAGDLWLLHGSYLQDWLASASDTNWRVDPALGGGSRAFGDIGVHWCDLMEFTTGHKITRLTAKTSTAFAQRVSGDDMAPVGTEDGATVLFETDRGAAGSVVVSQVSPGRKNRLWFSFDGTEASYSFDQELPDSLWVGGRGENRIVPRGPDTFTSVAARNLSFLPAGHPQGYQDCFTAFVKEVYAAVRGEAPEGMPTFDDGHRAAVLTEAVLDSAKNHSWVEVPT